MVSIPRTTRKAGQQPHRCPSLKSRSQSRLRTIQGDPVRHIPENQERSSPSLHIRVPPVVFATALAIMGLMLLAPRTVSAQASAGITGTITDTSGAVVKGAQVTIT